MDARSVLDALICAVIEAKLSFMFASAPDPETAAIVVEAVPPELSVRESVVVAEGSATVVALSATAAEPRASVAVVGPHS